jgi:CDP-2,3-bis-(O-geranylgeranyl)-sn-glycerol synthase
MLLIILQSLYFILPAYVANMAPVIFKFIPFGASPMDFGASWRGERLLGSHKTWRGLLAGIFGGIFTIFVQNIFAESTQNISLINYATLNVWEIFLLGCLFGGGAIIGDAVKSFFKRRLHIASGRPFFPFDQLDFVIGALLAVSIVFVPPLPHIITILVITPLFHFLTNVAAYFLKLKKVWW